MSEFDNAVVQLATLSAKPHDQGRGIFDAARNTDLVNRGAGDRAQYFCTAGANSNAKALT